MVDLSNFRHFLGAREAVRSDTLSIWHCEALKRCRQKLIFYSFIHRVTTLDVNIFLVSGVLSFLLSISFLIHTFRYLRRFAKEISRQLRIDEKRKPIPVQFGFSFGVAEYEDGESMRSVLRRADTAMYRMKNHYRNPPAVSS